MGISEVLYTLSYSSVNTRIIYVIVFLMSVKWTGDLLGVEDVMKIVNTR